MRFAVFALAAINVAVGTQGFVFAGLLPDMARDLGVTVGQLGMLLAANSLMFAIGAPIAAVLTARMERRRVIVLALLALTAINMACAVAPAFQHLVLLRVLAGVSTAFVGALATVTAAALVPPDMRGRAFAIVIGGLTLAFVLGVPVGSAIGGAYGWRTTFVFAAAICVLALVLILASVPKVHPTPVAPAAFGQALRKPLVYGPMIVTLLAFFATFTVVAFIGPVITYATGATGGGVGALQSAIGFGSLAGLALGGRAVDRGSDRRATLVALAVMAISLCAYWPVMAAEAGSVSRLLLGALILVGAAALFALIPINLAQIAVAAGPAAPVALALNGSLVSLGQGLGALLGGWLTDNIGAHAMGPGGAAIAVMALLISVGVGRAKQTASAATAGSGSA
jgi:MFS transporter, DHA1 family, inner membrane transport protein